MPSRLIALFAAVLWVLTGCGRPEAEPIAPPEAADTVFVGGVVRTGVGEAPAAEAVAVADGRIVFVGARVGVGAYIDDATHVVDIDGAVLFPGFVDAHAHLLGVGMRETTLNLEGVGSIAELVEVVAAQAAVTPTNGVIYGRGWIESEWPDGRFPTVEDIDPVSQDVAVVLVRGDGHAMLLNSLAMIHVWINHTVQDPEGGRYERFPDGRLTGLLVDNAMERARGLIDEPRGAERDDALAAGAIVYAGYGWTGLHNMSVAPQDVDAIERLAEDGLIEIRVYNGVDPDGAERALADGRRTAASGRVLTRGVKLYMDGALGSRGAALMEAYADRPDVAGLLVRQQDETVALFERALRDGWQLSVHAIGDRANRLALDWMEAAMTNVPVSERAVAEPRWRIEHAQVLDEADVARFAELGVIASMQPSHFASDQHFAPARLGEGRLGGAYAWRRLLDAGAIVVGGSDAPVERGDPIREFHAAVARSDADGVRVAGFSADQAVTRAEALAMFTLWPAYASFQENELGTIEVGKRADFTAFSADLMTIPVEDILDQRAVMTVVDGAVIYRRRMQ